MTGAVFISHSSRDATLAHDLVVALEAVGVACWISGRDVAPGGNHQEVTAAAVRSRRALVLLLVEEPTSDGVETENAIQ